MAKRIIRGVTRNLNWHPGRPNHNFKIWRPRADATPLPSVVQPLDDGNISIWDQGELGSCTAHGTGFLWVYRLFKEGRGILQPSRLFIYYCERMMEGDPDDDNGAQVADGLIALQQYGCPLESEWPYDITQFAVRPPAPCWTDGLKDVALAKNQVPIDLNSIKQSLAADLPISFGFTVFESFESDIVANTGIMPMPQPHEGVIGGHCVAVVGYDDSKQALWIRNSWGTGWGINGRFLMPYANLTNCSDGWNLPAVK